MRLNRKLNVFVQCHGFNKKFNFTSQNVIFSVAASVYSDFLFCTPVDTPIVFKKKLSSSFHIEQMAKCTTSCCLEHIASQFKPVLIRDIQYRFVKPIVVLIYMQKPPFDVWIVTHQIFN